ncbi:insulinase family protein, partial [Helicobacter sp. UBA3407]
ASKILKSMLFKGSALEFPLSGTQDSIAKITLREIENFYRQHINLNSLILIVGGELEFESVAKELENALESLPQGKAVALKPIFANDLRQTKRLLKDTQQAYIYFGAPLNVDNLQKESALIKVASFVLGGSGFGSRMLEEVRVKRGLAYSAVMRLNATHTQASAQGYLQTSLKNEKEAQSLVQQVVEEFVEKGITSKELQEAKDYLLGSEPLRNETLSQRLGTAFTYYYNGLPLDFNKQVLEEISKLTLKEVNDYIQSHQEIKNLSFAIVSAEN